MTGWCAAGDEYQVSTCTAEDDAVCGVLTECDAETEFDPRSNRDTWYNALRCKSRVRTDRRLGGGWVSSSEVGTGIAALDHGQFKAKHGHIKATKTFFDRSHLNVGANLG